MSPTHLFWLVALLGCHHDAPTEPTAQTVVPVDQRPPVASWKGERCVEAMNDRLGWNFGWGWIQLSWTFPPVPWNRGPYEIQVERAHDEGDFQAVTPWWPIETSSWDDETADPSRHHRYRIMVRGPDGIVDPASPVLDVPSRKEPPCPPVLNPAWDADAHFVRMTWRPIHDQRIEVSIDRAPFGGEPWVPMSGWLGVDVTEWSDPYAPPDRDIQYRATARQPRGESGVPGEGVPVQPIRPPAGP